MARTITKAHPYTPESGQFTGRTFSTEREYRDALARAKGYGSFEQQRQLVGQHGWKRWTVFTVEEGKVDLDIRNRRTSGKLAGYDNAIRKFIHDGDNRDLRQYEGKRIRTKGKTYTLLTNEAELVRFHETGDASVEYASTPVE